jgi:guanylate kinase
VSNHYIIILSGPSAVGKTTIADKLLEEQNWARIITCTSRTPRENEENYIFLEEKVFEKKIIDGEFIEYSKVYGNYYGILKKTFQESYQKHNYSLVTLNTVGSKKMMDYCKKELIPYKSIFLATKKKEEIENRLRKREEKGISSSKDIQNRLLAMEEELQDAKVFHKKIYNYDIQTCLKEIQKFVYEDL